MKLKLTTKEIEATELLKIHMRRSLKSSYKVDGLCNRNSYSLGK